MAGEKTTELEFEEEDDLELVEQLDPKSSAAVVSPTDWTTETIVTQLKRKNIDLSPRFQRRDAWKRDRKSRFIESLIIGLPVPQIVLAEAKDNRGKFIVLDGKQRLLSILQFWGLGEGANNSFSLSALPLRPDLKGVSFTQLSTDSAFEGDYNSLCNQSIRTVVIRNWQHSSFLHAVFLRLNTGSVQLSPQELRQALLPGEFSEWVDEAAAVSPGIRQLLNLTGPDPRMRDVEVLSRYLAFRFFADTYPGRMKAFLDRAFETMNEEWDGYKDKVISAAEEFEEGVASLVSSLGTRVARKPDSPQFNRAIFDALIYFHSQPGVRELLRGKAKELRAAYEHLFVEDSDFAVAIESDTAGTPNTTARMTIWAERLSAVAGTTIHAPNLPPPKEKRKTRPNQ